MKKILFILCLFLVVTTNSKAQTKEETITWMQQKLQKYLYYDTPRATGENLSVEVTECFITIKFTIINIEHQERVKYYNQYFKIPTDGAQFGFFIEMNNGVESIRVKSYNNGESFTKTANVKMVHHKYAYLMS
jgi:hypothetical protein